MWKSVGAAFRRGRRRYGVSRYLLRVANEQVNRRFFRSDKEGLIRAFRGLGLQRGMTVCVHAALSKLGYIEGGAQALVEALLDAVGDDGCLMMPSFSLTGTMKAYIDSGAVFDVRNTPSQVGAIAEAFRLREGVLRSLHPTNSVAAVGRGAEDLIADHDKSLTPYGENTPYGRFARRNDAYVLMLNTHVHSLLHHIQERVDFPNLFLEGERNVSMIDYDGTRKSMVTKVMRPRLPYYLAVPSRSGDAPDWALLHDFCLLFPPSRDKLIARAGYRARGHMDLRRNRERFVAEGVLRPAALGRGEMGLLHVPPFVAAAQARMEESITSFREYYDVSILERIDLPMV